MGFRPGLAKLVVVVFVGYLGFDMGFAVGKSSVVVDTGSVFGMDFVVDMNSIGVGSAVGTSSID